MSFLAYCHDLTFTSYCALSSYANKNVALTVIAYGDQARQGKGNFGIRRLRNMLEPQLVVCLCIVATLTGGVSAENSDCISGISYLYSGYHSITSSGYECQRWDEDLPHNVIHVPQDGGGHNFCRNPDKSMRGTWCYTSDPEVRWEHCTIPKCPSNAIIMYTVIDETRINSSFSQVNGDLEYMSQKYEGSEETESADFGTWQSSCFKMLDANYEKRLLYFTDIEANYFGFYHMDTKVIEKFLVGMVEHIEAISYDWVTNNFYWTDSKMKSILVADPTLQTYTPIYSPSEGYAPYAFEVHSVRRLLIFSTYIRKTPEETGAKIITTDLSGDNEQVIFNYPDVARVVALTVDYIEDRIYWTEQIGDKSKVFSSKIDGTDKTELYSAERAAYNDIAVFSDYVYISDTLKRYNFFGELRYHVQVLTKSSDQVAHYKLKDKPMGIAVYDKNDLLETIKPKGPGECNANGKCGGICLPTFKGSGKCKCSIGYQLNPKTKKCITKIAQDEYLLVVDAKEGHAYQIPLGSESESRIALLGKADRITSAAVDPSSKFVYFSEESSMSVQRGILGHDANVRVAKSTALYIEIDPLTGNIFYSTDNTITVSSADGKAQKVIVKPETDDGTSDIKAFTLDLKNKYLYWTDTNSAEEAGKVMRCRFDGTRKKTVLENLNWPHGITFDFKANKLYVMESKFGALYELPIGQLIKLTSTSVDRFKYRKHDLRKLIWFRNFLLTEVKVHKNIAYIADDTQSQVLKFQLDDEPALTGFGPATFYQASSLSVYSKSTYNKVINKLPNPCKRRTCPLLCVDMNKRRAKCLNGGKPKRKSRKN